MQTSPSLLKYVILGWTGLYLIITALYFYKYVIRLGYGFPAMVEAYDPQYEYIGPVLYLLKQGVYWTDYRMPGFAAIYVILYGVTQNEYYANVLFTILSLLAIIAAMILSMTYVMNKTKSYLYVSLIGFAWATNPVLHRWFSIGTEGMAISCIILSIIALARERYLLAGTLLTLSIFLRPISGVLLVPIGLHLWKVTGYPPPWQFSKNRAIILTFLPFLITESAWIIRNYLRYKDFRPLSGTGTMQNETMYGTPEVKSISLLIRMGMSTDNTLSQLFEHGKVIDSASFMFFVPKRYLPDTLLTKLKRLIHMQNSRAEKDCDYLLKIEQLSGEIMKDVKIPLYAKVLNRLYHSIFGDIVFLHKETSPWRLILLLAKHPLHAISSILIVLVLTIPIGILASAILWRGDFLKVLLLVLIGVSPMWAHLLTGIVDHRYLTSYLPLATLTLIESTLYLQRKKS
ncbi:MAG: hypothetical protein RMJ66_01475 [Bacteroidia bacterium]|nr:hypothetical protein [Bacteroidia bacterium]MDW8133715.1 hypothetical protein [Bacteroidia bacterium]